MRIITADHKNKSGITFKATAEKVIHNGEEIKKDVNMELAYVFEPVGDGNFSGTDLNIKISFDMKKVK